MMRCSAPQPKWTAWCSVPVVVRASVTAVALFLAGSSLAAELRIPAMDREGNAAVLLSRESGFAILIDGGKAGRGGTAPELGGGGLLREWYDQGYRGLLVVCSHSHADHNGKIKEVVRHRAEAPGDVDLSSFDRVFLVDSEYDSEKSLAAEARRAHGETHKIQHIDATRMKLSGRSDLTGLLSRASDLALDNLDYEPVGKAGVHGRAVITEARLSKDGHMLIYLDSDDADEEAIRRALMKRGPPGDGTLLVNYPHHGSRHSNLKPFADLGWKPEYIVFQTNYRNRYDHPHPEALLEAVRSVGVDHVYVTGAQATDLVFDGRRPQPLGQEEIAKVVSLILRPKIEAAEREMTRLEHSRYEKPSELEAGGLRARRDAVGISQAELAKLLDVNIEDVRRWEREGLVPAERRDLVAWTLHQARIDKKLEEQARRATALQEVGRSYSEHLATEDRRVLLASLRRLPPTGGAPSEPGALRGGGAHVLWQVRGKRWPDPPPPSAAGAFDDGTLGFAELAARLAMSSPESRSGQRSLGTPAASGGPTSERARARSVRFVRTVRGRAVFGGVVIGNEVDGPCVSQARLWGETLTLDGEEVFVPFLEVVLRTEKGTRTLRYDDWTPTELWSAYHFVQPPDRWKQEYNVTEGGGGLVGILPRAGASPDEDEPDVWTFGVHPAIAGTPIARDAMMLDMMPDYLQDSSVRSFLEDLSYSSYQWMDLPSVIGADHDRLRVESSDRDRKTVLGLRLIDDSPLLWLEALTIPSFLQAERMRLFQRIILEQSRGVRLPKEEALNDLLAQLEPHFSFNLLSATPTSIERLLAEIDEPLRDERNSRLLDLPLDDAGFVDKAYERYDIVRRIDRFARAVALLNWLADQGKLPEQLHPLTRPVRYFVPAEVSIDVLEDYLVVADSVANERADEVGGEPQDTVPMPEREQESFVCEQRDEAYELAAFVWLLPFALVVGLSAFWLSGRPWFRLVRRGAEQ